MSHHRPPGYLNASHHPSASIRSKIDYRTRSRSGLYTPACYAICVWQQDATMSRARQRHVRGDCRVQRLGSFVSQSASESRYIANSTYIFPGLVARMKNLRLSHWRALQLVGQNAPKSQHCYSRNKAKVRAISLNVHMFTTFYSRHTRLTRIFHHTNFQLAQTIVLCGERTNTSNMVCHLKNMMGPTAPSDATFSVV